MVVYTPYSYLLGTGWWFIPLIQSYLLGRASLVYIPNSYLLFRFWWCTSLVETFLHQEVNPLVVNFFVWVSLDYKEANLA